MSAFMPDDPRLVSGKRTGASRGSRSSLIRSAFSKPNVALWLTPNGDYPHRGNRKSYVVLLGSSSTTRRHEQLKTCVFHASLLHLPIVGFQGRSARIASATCAPRVGLPAVPSTVRGAGGVWLKVDERLSRDSFRARSGRWREREVV
jgi:hypothetical protein